jgi:plasmid segregation protein ParM
MDAVGVDLGYGLVKWSHGAACGAFASAWVPDGGGADGWGMGGPPVLLVDGAPVVAGEPAALHPAARRPFADGRLADPEALPLLASALWHAGVEGEVVLGSGPPLGRFAAEREAARAALEGRTLRLGDGRRERVVRIARLVLRPQGVGAALYLAARGLLPPGAGLAAVVDVGTRTTDVVALVLRDLSPVPDLCCSLGLGAATAANALAREVQRRTGHLPSFDLAMAALREPQPWHGGTVGGPEEAAPHLDALAGAIRQELLRVFGDAAQQVTTVALVGGAAALLGGRLRGLLPGRAIALTDREMMHANAIGFCWAAERTARGA